MIVTTVNTENAPAAIGPYSQATIYNSQAFVSGQIGLVPATGEFISDDVQEQTRQALENLKSILEACGSALTKVISVDVFLADMDDFAKVNEVYSEFFANHKPARAATESSRLPKDALVEIKCIAAV